MPAPNLFLIYVTDIERRNHTTKCSAAPSWSPTLTATSSESAPSTNPTPRPHTEIHNDENCWCHLCED